eukprot:g35427.t1
MFVVNMLSCSIVMCDVFVNVYDLSGFDQLFCASMLNWVFCLLLGIPCVFCYLGSRTTDGLWALWDFQEGLPVNKKATDIIPSYTLEKQWDNASQTYVATPHEAEQVDGLFPRRLGSLEFFGDWYWNPTRRGAHFRSSGFARQAQDASLWPTTQDFSLEVWYRDTVPYSNEFRGKMNIVGFGRSRNSWDCVGMTCVKDLNLAYMPGSFEGAWFSISDKSISGYDCKTWKNGSSVGWGWGEIQIIDDCKRRCESNFPLCTGFEYRSSRCYFKSRIRRGEEVPAAGSTIYYIKEPEPITWMNTTGDPLRGSCSEIFVNMNTPYEFGRLTHLLLTRHAIYVNGSEALKFKIGGSTIRPLKFRPLNASGGLTVSSECDDWTTSFQGEIFLVAYYGRSLTAAEVKQNFKAFLPENPTVVIEDLNYTCYEDELCDIYLYAYDMDHLFAIEQSNFSYTDINPVFTLLTFPSPHGSFWLNGELLRQLPKKVDYDAGDVLHFLGGPDEIANTSFTFAVYDQDYKEWRGPGTAYVRMIDTNDPPKAPDLLIETYYEAAQAPVFQLKGTDQDRAGPGSFITGVFIVGLLPFYGDLVDLTTNVTINVTSPYPLVNFSQIENISSIAAPFNLTYQRNTVLPKNLNGQRIVAVENIYYVVYDAIAFSASGKVTIKFLNPLQPTDAVFEGPEDTQLPVTFTGNSTLPSFKVVVVSPPSQGWLFPAGVTTAAANGTGALTANDFPYTVDLQSSNSSTLLYMPFRDLWGQIDTLTYELFDPVTEWRSARGYVKIYITPVNDPPTLTGNVSQVFVSLLEEQFISMNLTDIDNSDIEFSVNISLESLNNESLEGAQVAVANASLHLLYFQLADGHFANEMRFMGTQAAVTLALSELRIRAHDRGVQIITVSLSDNGICEQSLVHPKEDCEPGRAYTASWNGTVYSGGRVPAEPATLQEEPTVMGMWAAMMAVPILCCMLVVWKQSRRVLGYKVLPQEDAEFGEEKRNAAPSSKITEDLLPHNRKEQQAEVSRSSAGEGSSGVLDRDSNMSIVTSPVPEGRAEGEPEHNNLSTDAEGGPGSLPGEVKSHSNIKVTPVPKQEPQLERGSFSQNTPTQDNTLSAPAATPGATPELSPLKLSNLAKTLRMPGLPPPRTSSGPAPIETAPPARQALQDPGMPTRINSAGPANNEPEPGLPRAKSGSKGSAKRGGPPTAPPPRSTAGQASPQPPRANKGPVPPPKPVDRPKWRRFSTDDGSGRFYYFNETTQETTWTAPPVFLTKEGHIMKANEEYM